MFGSLGGRGLMKKLLLTVMASLAAFSANAYKVPQLDDDYQEVVEIFGEPCDKPEPGKDPVWVISMDGSDTLQARFKNGRLTGELFTSNREYSDEVFKLLMKYCSRFDKTWCEMTTDEEKNAEKGNHPVLGDLGRQIRRLAGKRTER
jgi:hypothetical protein